MYQLVLIPQIFKLYLIKLYLVTFLEYISIFIIISNIVIVSNNKLHYWIALYE